MAGCLFCNMVAGKIPADVVLDNEHVLAFRDIRPVAPVHALVIPKVHVAGIHEATPEHAAVLGQVMLAARDVAEKLGLGPGGYRLVINQGADAGQSVFHLHCHVLGGRPMAWPPG
ncbi:MAG TPA: histidine triad nucleotide-binding protein [Polyangiaceae bacterium]|jgi:histidine triad (HIT) family protein|nr:histidine triad nucleotide-binding protein [Polyangiaceae bacterium]